MRTIFSIWRYEKKLFVFEMVRLTLNENLELVVEEVLLVLGGVGAGLA